MKPVNPHLCSIALQQTVDEDCFHAEILTFIVTDRVIEKDK